MIKSKGPFEMKQKFDKIPNFQMFIPMGFPILANL